MPRDRAPLTEYGYSLGRSVRPRGVDLWSRLDRSTRVIGPMGSGKTMRLLAPALRSAPGAALATTTKADLYLLTVVPRRRLGPVVAMDPLRIVPGADPLRWSPIYGAQKSRTAENRGRAFAAGGGTTRAAAESEGAAFYRHRAGTLLMCLFHAAALDGASLRDVLRWAAHPGDPAPHTILATNPGAVPGWDDKLHGLLTGDSRMLTNTLGTVELALAPFDHPDVLEMVDVPHEQCTDLRRLILDRGTVYALGKDTPYGSLSPLMTAICEDVFDTAEDLAYEAPTERLDPPFLAALDEAPNIAPIPTLRQRIADGRGRGIGVIYAAQSWAGVEARWGQSEADELAASTSNVVVYGGCKDPRFLADMEKLCGLTEVTKRSHSRSHAPGGALLGPGTSSTSTHKAWEPVLRAHEIGTLDVDRGHALILAGNLPPVIARQPALFQQRKLWREVITGEVETVRAENTTARTRGSAAPGSGGVAVTKEV